MSDNFEFSILVVDDERSELDVLTYILEQEYNIYVAKSAQTALRIAFKNLPDLILLDIVMPDKSGFEVLSELKQNDATRNIPVIFITGLDRVEEEEKGLALGAVDYITKPFHHSIVRARVKNHLQMVKQMRTIERIGLIDSLTEISNRRCFDDRVDTEWKRAVREETVISLLMLDIDKFKQCNDTYGHAQGDVVLKVIAKILKSSLKRPGDFAARWGGEEFTVLLPNTDFYGAYEIAENIRINIEKTPIPNIAGGNPLKITASIGITSETPSVDDSIQEFIKKSDDALYYAKGTGRNRVCPCIPKNSNDEN